MTETCSENPTRILILTAGGTGKELYDLLSLDSSVVVKGFLDDNAKDERVLGVINDWSKFKSYRLISAMGSYKNMALREKILSSIPLEYFIHYRSSQALVYPSANTCAYSSVIFPYAVISANAELAQHTFVYHHAIVSHDVHIGPFTIISNHVSISGRASIGHNCYIGTNASIKEGIKIGNQAIIASGASVIHDVPDKFIYIRPNYMVRNHYL